jgi:hypothetical protein
MNVGLKPGATPAETHTLLGAALAGFRQGATGARSMGDPSAGITTGPQRAAWRSGWLAGARVCAYLSPSCEHTQQRALFEWLHVCSLACPELELAYAVPNGGLRAKGVAGKLKAEGVKAGVPDVCLPLRSGEMGALYIEMKSKDGKRNAAQIERMPRLAAAGNTVLVCNSWGEAADAVMTYMSGRLGAAL